MVESPIELLESGDEFDGAAALDNTRDLDSGSAEPVAEVSERGEEDEEPIMEDEGISENEARNRMRIKIDEDPKNILK